MMRKVCLDNYVLTALQFYGINAPFDNKAHKKSTLRNSVLSSGYLPLYSNDTELAFIGIQPICSYV